MELQNVVSKMKLYLFDMDGTLYLGNRLYSFTQELLSTIRNCGAKYLFMTNNSSKSVNDYIKKLAGLGIESTREDFITSSQATAYYLKKHHWGKTIYVCGTQSLKQELVDEGFTVSEDISQTQCIVMGFDTELTFQKLHDVSYLLLTQPDLPYIATNPDLVCPTEFGSVPDCGSVCDMLYNATGKRPLVIGKPATLIPQLAMERTGCTQKETALVGDRLYTDIQCGLNAGLLSVLVLSGETTRETLAASDIKPDVVLPNGAAIMDALI